MFSSSKPKGQRNSERISLLLVMVVMGFLFWKLYMVLQRDFVDVQSRLENGTMINLNDKDPGKNMEKLLVKGKYFEDPKDISFISSKISAATDSITTIDNIGELNKKKYFVLADDAMANGGKAFKRRVELSRNLLGFSESDSITYKNEKLKLLPTTADVNAAVGPGTISGRIVASEGHDVNGALVRLKLLSPPDSVIASNGSEGATTVVKTSEGVRKIFAIDSGKTLRMISFTAYARTNAAGRFTFSGLPENNSYEIIPLQPGYEFGRPQGIENLKQNASFSFIQTPHMLRLFSSRDFNNLKKEKAFIVRTPAEVINWFWIITGIFFGAFVVLHLVLTIKFPAADQLLLPVLMILTGLSLITLFSLQDPLRDRFLAQSTFIYFCFGITGILILQFVNIRRFTTDSAFFRLFVFKDGRSAANGWPWALIAIGLLALTILFGTGPQGSGVKVNLFGFQPSEIVKFMVIIFLAGFFATNEKFIAEYNAWNKRLPFFATALVAIVLSILAFLILGDLGPAIVCCFAFIVLFSFSRGDFMQVVAALILYALMVWTFVNLWIATGVTAAVLILYMLLAKRKLSESTTMAMVVVGGFLLLDKLTFLSSIIPGPLQRLVDRKAIWADAWNNQVFGGDQVANGIWAISTGGFSGQGAGEGFSKTIPEAHTDMILPAIGEEFGWAGIVSIFIMFLLYLHRSILIGRQTGTPFLFYVCAGIGIGTFIQFLLIAGGSTGALPLSGVVLPFISYGGTSLLCNMIAAGFLLSVSRHAGTQTQMNYITKTQDRNLLPALLAACVAIILLIVNVSRYSFNNNRWIVEPALVADRSGARMYSYNPRINILMNRLQAGNLYDRSGRLLATSDLKLVQDQEESLLALGISHAQIKSLSYKRANRYYPFGAHMFFWTGDANTGIFSGGTNGYFAEYAHAPELRGFPTSEAAYQVSANKFRPEKFLPTSQTEMTVTKRDFSALSALLLAGINSSEVSKFKEKNRDIRLSLDAALQTKIQVALQGDDSLHNKRISVVIMEDNTGDVLTSASYPLPDVDDWEHMNLGESETNKLPGWHVNADIGFTHATQPGSTAKLITALAGFNKLGNIVAQKPIRINSADLIRTNGPEPDEAGLITLERAIVRSNNAFFIRLANENHLEEEMANLYMQSGMFLQGVGGYYYENAIHNDAQREKWRAIWRKTVFTSHKKYNPANIRRTRALGISGMSWGQGELVATPASVARIAAGIANNGLMIPNRYVLEISGNKISNKAGVPITNDPGYAQQMTNFMRAQSEPKKNRLGILVAGKTGTPERIFKGEQINDGWYVFFAPKATGEGHLVVSVRMEGAKGSSEAVKLSAKHIIPILLNGNYIKNFEPLPKKNSRMLAQARE